MVFICYMVYVFFCEFILYILPLFHGEYELEAQADPRSDDGCCGKQLINLYLLIPRSLQIGCAIICCCRFIRQLRALDVFIHLLEIENRGEVLAGQPHLHGQPRNHPQTQLRELLLGSCQHNQRIYLSGPPNWIDIEQQLLLKPPVYNYSSAVICVPGDMVLLVVVIVHQAQSIQITPAQEAGLHHPRNPHHRLLALQHHYNRDQ